MAATVSLLQRLKLTNERMNICTVAFDDSYPTGGEAVTAEQLGLTVVDAVIPLSAGGYVSEYDEANEKLLVYYGNNDGTADGPLVQVANETDLSELTVKVIAIGK